DYYCQSYDSSTYVI
nr:immunoglobulin light chain junction region [Macaca mulatta]MOX16896.1 immunoglobulin light chain junction region [Macaca mulatta]MOX16919.1 immunoglobulin light chain junction region [Macaca mulatta]MOX17146.1 immunoglobulin light chain junction region [Macaca mulatta]MOX17158.1 immunoglobulin light chain junction region [Macaca mulatta]